MFLYLAKLASQSGTKSMRNGASGRMILPDNETKVDLLNNEAIAKTIIQVLRATPEHPVTVGVHGDWGAGKSSILEMIQFNLEQEEKILCIKFNGWRFQGFEDAKIALIEGIVTSLIEKRPALTKAGDTVKEIFRRIDWLKVARYGGGLALTAFTGIPTPDSVAAAMTLLKTLGSSSGDIVTKENYDKLVAGLESVVRTAEPRHVPKEIDEFRKEFDELLRKADVDQLIVLVDDLDRCLPDTAIETLEAIRLFVFTSRTAFVVAADEAMIEYAVRKHFPDLPDTTGPRDYARNYLEKLIQVPFRIPALGVVETRIYITLLLIGAELEGDPAFDALIGVAREKLKRPWEGDHLDADVVRRTLGVRAAAANQALLLDNQIGQILAEGTQGNPRQIKRFLNTLLLRRQMANARGFGGDINSGVLAKLMLAERFIPRLFDQIAQASGRHPKGFCEDLASLERAPQEGGDAKRKTIEPKRPSASPVEGLVLTEWRASPAIVAWSSVKPPLAELDLRPYFFLSKDRKDYLGVTSALGHLRAVVDKLMGPRMAVANMEGELKSLVIDEARKVFEALRSKVIESDALATEPDGVQGLIMLVKAHPGLQSSLLDFLESLPAEDVGPWVTAGWQSTLKDHTQLVRYKQLLADWASDGNPLLKAAAAASLKMMAK